MARAQEKLCDFCLQQPATNSGLWLGPGLATRLCIDCLATSLTYEYLVDDLRKRKSLPEEVTQKVNAVLKDMSKRMGLQIEPLKQEVEALGVKLNDTPKGEE